MSRRAPRFRIDLKVTVSPLLGGQLVVCHTRDVSDVGICLDTAEWLPVGTRVSLALTDPQSGSALEVIGDVVREVNGTNPALGVLLIEPPPEWKGLVAYAARSTAGTEPRPVRRMRVLVVGDDHRQRGAMALYVSSGWDILFASDDFAVHEALENIKLDAVIAELDATDPRIAEIMDDVRKAQPAARRIVRGSTPPGHAKPNRPADLVHRFVERDSGLDALVDAVTATNLGV